MRLCAPVLVLVVGRLCYTRRSGGQGVLSEAVEHVGVGDAIVNRGGGEKKQF